jgi:NAD(P)-dependent dehydrogenase (short-subunit alcohol dehydrogenase family)
VTTPQLSPRRLDHDAVLLTLEKDTPRRSRALVAGVILFLATAAVLVAGGWGVLASLSAEEPPARPGERVAVDGGFLRVDAVLPEHMAPMQSSKFATNGMSMSAMGMDMAPEGYRRFAVEMTLSAPENGSFDYSASDFRLSGDGMEKAAEPIRHQLADGAVAPGSSVSGSMVFEVPEKASNLRLSFDGGREIALDLEPATARHSHGGHEH